jgi:hypothetical protein
MTIFDLVLILPILGSVLTLCMLFFFLLRRQWRRARHVALALFSCVVLYAAVLVSVSLFSPERVLTMHQNRCFDDWCLSVERVVQQPTVGATPTVVLAHGAFYLVTVLVSSQAKAISQRALDAQVYLLDARGQRFDPSAPGQQALDATGQGGQALSSELAPGGSFTRTSSSTCLKAHPILPWWSRMVSSQISLSSEVSRASFTSRPSSNSSSMDEGQPLQPRTLVLYW